MNFDTTTPSQVAAHLSRPGYGLNLECNDIFTIKLVPVVPMTKIFQDRKFNNFHDRNSGKTFSDLEFHRCYFESCRISWTRDPRRRTTVRNVKIIDCEQRGCALDAAVIADILVDGFKTDTLFQTWGAVFKHVTLRGKLGDLMISPYTSVFIARAMKNFSVQKPFDEANRLYYSSVDWALDIREAQFEDADLRGVPGMLILRDPETQFLITREKALDGKWKEIDLSGTHWKTSIEFFLETNLDSNVLVAPKRHPRFRPLLAGLWALRDAGVVS